MAIENAQTRTLRRASETAGSTEQLAELLGCDMGFLVLWLSGDQPTPSRIYLKALDLVSQGARPVPPGKSKP